MLFRSRAFFGCLDAGDARHGEYIAFLVGAIGDHLQGCRLHVDPRFSGGGTLGNVLGTHIHHVGVALGIKDRNAYLQPGDVVTLGIKGLGEQRQKVVSFKA